jgi:hypothetical protein
VILQPVELRAVELGVPDHASGPVDERHAVAEGRAGGIGECVGGGAGSPLRRHEPRLARELADRLLSDVEVEPLVDHRHDDDDEHGDDD